jgi:hypothetical protein
MWKVAAAALLLFVTFTSASFWQACPNSQGVAPDDVRSPSCSGNSCQGVRGDRLVANITFTPRINHADLRVDVWAVIFGVQIPLPGEYPHDNVSRFEMALR